VFITDVLLIESLLSDQPSLQIFLQAPLNIANILGPQLAIGLAIFVAGAIAQNRAHVYLWRLRKNGTYTFPLHPLFLLTLTPHYFAECIEYVGLMVAAAAPDQYVNKTIASMLVFVVVNLGVTASGTYGWYAQRFGQDKVKGKARMIPLIW
jgi:3-oxo-5-alpha-steroid 4-dehydrogenase 3